MTRVGHGASGQREDVRSVRLVREICIHQDFLEDVSPSGPCSVIQLRREYAVEEWKEMTIVPRLWDGTKNRFCLMRCCVPMVLRQPELVLVVLRVKW